MTLEVSLRPTVPLELPTTPSSALQLGEVSISARICGAICFVLGVTRLIIADGAV